MYGMSHALPSLSGGSKVIHGIIARKEGEPGNKVNVCVAIVLLRTYICTHTQSGVKQLFQLPFYTRGYVYSQICALPYAYVYAYNYVRDTDILLFCLKLFLVRSKPDRPDHVRPSCVNNSAISVWNSNIVVLF